MKKTRQKGLHVANFGEKKKIVCNSTFEGSGEILFLKS